MQQTNDAADMASAEQVSSAMANMLGYPCMHEQYTQSPNSCTEGMTKTSYRSWGLPILITLPQLLGQPSVSVEAKTKALPSIKLNLNVRAV